MAFGIDDALIIASLIASAAGTAASYAGAEKVKKQQKRMLDIEGERQREYQDRIDRRVAQTGSQVDRLATERQMQAGAQQRMSAMPDVAPPAGEYIQGVSDAPEVVKSDLARVFLNELQRGKGEMRARAKLGGYKDAMLAQQFALARSGQDVGREVGFSQGSQGALGAELDAAHFKGVPYNLSADVLNSLGQLGMVYAATRPPQRGELVGGGLNPAAGGQTGITIPMDERLRLKPPARLPATSYEAPSLAYSW